MDKQVRKFLRDLRRASSVEPAWEVIDDWVRTRDLLRLRQAASALTEPSAGTREPVDRSVWDYLVRKLSLTPALEFALVVRDVARLRDPAYLASLVASGQTVDVAERLVAKPEIKDEEFLACLVQELALRETAVEREPFVSLWRSLEAHRHPLAWLPLRLAEIELEPELPDYGERGTSYTIPFGPTDVDMNEPRADFVARIKRDITSPLEADLCSKAFTDWLTNSNGKVDTHVLELDGELEALPVAEALAEAGIDCLAGGGAPRVVVADATEAFRIAFAAASLGGAYGHGSRGAYGRLHAWTTLAGLTGLGADASLEAIAAAAEQTRWFRFETDSGWFYGVAWDVGLMAYRTDEGALALLAATDTD